MLCNECHGENGIYIPKCDKCGKNFVAGEVNNTKDIIEAAAQCLGEWKTRDWLLFSETKAFGRFCDLLESHPIWCRK